MKHTLLLTANLLFTFSIHTMQYDKNAILEELSLISSQIEQNEQFHESSIKKLDELIETYDSLSAQVHNEDARTQLAHIKQNLIECRDMLDEDRQSNRFYFFNPGWNSEDDASNDQGIIDEQYDTAFNAEIEKDFKDIINLLE
jgi:hypothetical protein